MKANSGLRNKSKIVTPFAIVDPKELGARLKARRLGLRYSRTDVARTLKIRYGMLAALESGIVQDPGVLVMLALADHYGTTINKLLES